MDEQLPVEAQVGKSYALSGKIMLTAVVVLFSIIILLVGLHLYARWYVLRLRRRQPVRRRRRGTRTHIVFYADNHRSAAADRGLDPAVLKSIPVSLYSSSEAVPVECAVCLSEFEENEVVRLLPKCNHSFHIQCIDMWFHSHSTCPLCRSPVEPPANWTEPPAAAETEVSSSEPSSSSGTGNGRRKANGRARGLRLEAAPPRRAELETELTQSSPGSRLLSLKRLLSIGKKSPGGSGGAPAHVAGTSRGPTELDLESGLTE